MLTNHRITYGHIFIKSVYHTRSTSCVDLAYGVILMSIILILEYADSVCNFKTAMFLDGVTSVSSVNPNLDRVFHNVLGPASVGKSTDYGIRIRDNG